MSGAGCLATSRLNASTAPIALPQPVPSLSIRSLQRRLDGLESAAVTDHVLDLDGAEARVQKRCICAW